MRSSSLLVLVVLILFAACSDSFPAPPALSVELAGRLHALASDCRDEPGDPGPPHGYATIVTCYPPGDVTRASVVAMLIEGDSLGNLDIRLAEPVETAIPRLTIALRGLISDGDLDRIATELRSEAQQDHNTHRVIATRGHDTSVGISRYPPTTPIEVSVALHWNPR